MRGHTLIELAFVITLIGTGSTLLAPAARAYRDRASVVAARESLVGILVRARGAALETGGAAVRISSDPWTAEVVAADSTLLAVDFAAEHGVLLTLGSGGSEAELRFDALGLGRLAGQTIGFVRGESRAELVVSSYGRVRRR
jgi:type II secretory pathway pseudopilin PulG